MTERGRSLTWWQFLLIVIVYAAIIQGVGRIIGAGVDFDDAFETTSNLLKTALIPIALSSRVRDRRCDLAWLVATDHPRAAADAALGTDRADRDLLLAALIGTSWGNLLDQEAGLVLALVALVCIVGFTEELMFRGIGVVTFRRMQPH